MNTIFKKEITIHDKDGKRFYLKITNEWSWEWNRYFSICSQSWQWKFNPKSDIQQELLDIWNTYHLNWQSSWTIVQNKLLREQWLFNNYDYHTAKNYLSKHKLDWSDLSIVEYNKSNKAIEEYKNELWFFNSFTNKLLKQKTETIIKYIPDKWEEKYFENFKVSAWNSIKVVTIEWVWSRILQPRNPNRSPSYDDIIKIINRMDEVEYSDDIYISALVDEYKWKPFIYWHWWTYKDFPNNFQEDLFELIDKLIEEEDEYNSRKITIEDLDNEEFINHADENCDWQYEKLMAACLHEWVSWNGLENVISSDWDYWDIEWFDYYIYTEEEADEAHLEYIKNLVDDIWFEWFIWWRDIDVSIDDGWDITISQSISIDSNERCYSLAWYDWHEHEVDINWTTYFLYRNN